MSETALIPSTHPRYKNTPERRQKIVDFLRAGATRKDAAAAAGIHIDTFHQWLKESEFSEAVMEAEGECGALMAARIYHEATHRNGDPRFALEWLKRRRRDEWGDVTRVDITKLTDEQLIALLEREDTAGSSTTGTETANTSGF